MKTISSVGKMPIVIGILLIQLTASGGQADERAAVLPPGGAREIAKGGTWQPTKEEVAELEASLEQVSHLKAENWPASSNVHIDHPERYFRQYIGVIRSGKKQIYVNAFCSEIGPPPDWQKRLVDILDGGTCVWQAVYDPSAKRFLSLRINGVA